MARTMSISNLSYLSVAVAIATTTALPVAAQSKPAAIDRSVGVLIVAHGGRESWNSRVDSLAAAVRHGHVVTGPVGVSFLMGHRVPTHRFQDEVAKLRKAGAQRVVVVPALVSSSGGHYSEIRYLGGASDSLDATLMHHLHMSGLERPTGTQLTVTAALDDAPELARTLAARARAAVPSTRGRALFLFGDGPNSAEDYAAWMKRLRTVADSVKHATGFQSVVVELVRDDAPADVRAEAVKRARELITLQRQATHHDVVVVPILISSGDVAKKLPADLVGLPIVYAAEPLLPDAHMARWVERRVVEAVAHGAKR